MSTLLSILLLWFGLAEPAVVVNELEAGIESVAFEHIADPVERWRPLLEQHFPAEEVETALCIIRHESGGDPAADNPRSSATGLFQILAGPWGDHYGVTEDHFRDAELNVRLARDIWDQSGWVAWTTNRLCD
ncbi:MAG TPA: transglycosylase SLT domain-containing protein [Acidimicrobiia bacterium]|nr:transglycosylase SLT domain-containing protein [Acidimicrobiia bacterium]